jgi:hypothetical protein
MVDVNPEKDHAGNTVHTFSRRETPENEIAITAVNPAFSPLLLPVPTASKRENPLINLLCNIVIPSAVLMNLSTEKRLGPLWGLIVALAFPLGYGLYDLVARRTANALSILGFISVLLSGSFTLLKLGGMWFAVKDAVLPTLIGIAVLLTLKTRRPLVRDLFYNDQIVDVPRVDAALKARGKEAEFEALLRRASVAIALTFIATAPISFALVRAVLKSPAGTVAFNEELGRMHWLGPLVIAVPSVIVVMIVFWRMVNGLCGLTGLSQDEIFRTEQK